MPDAPILSEAEVQHLAGLARIALTPEEVRHLAGELTAIVDALLNVASSQVELGEPPRDDKASRTRLIADPQLVALALQLA